MATGHTKRLSGRRPNRSLGSARKRTGATGSVAGAAARAGRPVAVAAQEVVRGGRSPRPGGAAAGAREGAAPVPYGNSPRSSPVPEDRHGVTQTIEPTGWSFPVDVAVKPKVTLPSGGTVRL